MSPQFPMPEPEPDVKLHVNVTELEQFLSLIHESEERKRRLLEIETSLRDLRVACETQTANDAQRIIELRAELRNAVHKANTTLTRLCLATEALRKLLRMCDAVCDEEGWGHTESPFGVAMREARELLEAMAPYLK